MIEINKSQLAKQLGVSSPMVTKYVKSGVLDECFTPNGKKLYLEKATQAIAMSKKRGSDAPVEEREIDKAMQSPVIFTEESQNELSALLMLAKSPSQKVQITKDFWLGKLNRQKFLEAEGELISVAEAKAAIETILVPLNQYLNDQGNHLKNNFPSLSNEVLSWVDDENNRQKEQLQVTQWD